MITPNFWPVCSKCGDHLEIDSKYRPYNKLIVFVYDCFRCGVPRKIIRVEVKK